MLMVGETLNKIKLAARVLSVLFFSLSVFVVLSGIFIHVDPVTAFGYGLVGAGLLGGGCLFLYASYLTEK